MKQHALFLGILAFSQPLVAADLLQTYREARANDPVYASARATRDAGRENLPQGLAQLLPTISASGFTSDQRIPSAEPRYFAWKSRRKRFAKSSR